MSDGHLLLTRPKAQSLRFATACKARFGAALVPVVSPLIEIRQTARSIDLDGVGGLIFTSENGVKAFSGMSERRDLTAWCVGDRTAATARAEGMNALSAGGQLDDLVELIAGAAPNGELLHLRGAHVAGDSVDALRKRGLKARAQIIYDQVALPLSPQARAILEAPGIVIAPVFSPRSASLLNSELSQARAQVAVAAMSHAVAGKLSVQGIAEIEIAHRPDSAAMIDAIARLRDRMKP